MTTSFQCCSIVNATIPTITTSSTKEGNSHDGKETKGKPESHHEKTKVKREAHDEKVSKGKSEAPDGKATTKIPKKVVTPSPDKTIFAMLVMQCNKLYQLFVAVGAITRIKLQCLYG